MESNSQEEPITNSLGKNWEERNIYIEIDGLSREYLFVCMNDLHIIDDFSVIAENELSFIKERQKSFASKKGVLPLDFWHNITPYLDNYHADGILFLGDMIDYYSEGNLADLKEGFDMLETPYLYLRADHDITFAFRNYTEEQEKEAVPERNALEDELCDNSPLIIMEFDEFRIVGFNKSTSQLLPEGVEILNKIKEDDKPVILATHVPIQSAIDDEIDIKSREKWGDRSLVWGYRDAYYVPNENTSQLLNFIYTKDSPVVGVVGGHLHSGFSGKVTEKAPQYALRPSYRELVTLLHVVPTGSAPKE